MTMIAFRLVLSAILTSASVAASDETSNLRGHLVDPRTVSFKDQPITVVNVYYTLPVQEPRKPSIFETNLLERYGTQKVKYNIIYDSDCDCDQGPITATGPCVAVARPTKDEATNPGCPLEDLKCRYPTCTTLAADDEHCRMSSGFDARMYRNKVAANSKSLYIPLGHRKDSWESFQKVTDYKVSPILLPSTSRDYIFNAIYSENTNRQERRYLHDIISDASKMSNIPSFVHIATRWNRHPNNPKSEQLNTDDYVQVLMNSVFTLSPIGKNPECYRMYEAVEAGSIPITVLGEQYTNHVCKGSLDDWVNSPIIVLESWDDLVDTFEFYRIHPKALEKKQDDMMVWYNEYMHGTIGDFEKLVMSKNDLLQTN